MTIIQHWPLALFAAFAVIGMVAAYGLSKRPKRVNFVVSSGCVFCDLNLLPIYNAQGDLVHKTRHGEILCPIQQRAQEAANG